MSKKVKTMNILEWMKRILLGPEPSAVGCSCIVCNMRFESDSQAMNYTFMGRNRSAYVCLPCADSLDGVALGYGFPSGKP